MNRLFRYALITFGECILVAIMYLLFPKEKADLMILGMIVLSIVYLVNVFGYPTLIRQVVNNEAAGYGIAWLGTWLYSIATVVAVILFYWIDLSLVWQVVIHSIFLFLFLCGIYWASMTARYAGHLEQKYKIESHSIELLKAKAQLLQAVLHAGMNENTKQEVLEIIERIGYLIPNCSIVASTLESQANTLLDALSDAITARQPDAEISLLTEQCKAVLKQRTALCN